MNYFIHKYEEYNLCPNCDEKTLVYNHDNNAEFQFFTCKNCNKKFKLNADTGRIIEEVTDNK
mgnify:CR=1 FL=1